MEKICNKCGLSKKLESFGKRTSAKDGKMSDCKDCTNKRAAKVRQEYPERIWASRQKRKNKDAEYEKNYRKLHSEKYKQYNADYWKINSEKLETRRRERYFSMTKEERYLWNKTRALTKMGLTKKYFDELLLAQGRVCGNPACLNEVSDSLRPALSVDHDHSCCPKGKACESCVRGLLCGRCNQTLGKMNDSIPLLYGLIDYLDDWNNKTGEEP